MTSHVEALLPIAHPSARVICRKTVSRSRSRAPGTPAVPEARPRKAPSPKGGVRGARTPTTLDLVQRYLVALQCVPCQTERLHNMTYLGNVLASATCTVCGETFR